MKVPKLLIAATFAVVPAVGALGGNVIVDLTGRTSNDPFGGANEVLLIDTGIANGEVTGIAWDLAFTPFAPSWTSEPHMTYGDSAGSNAYDWDMGDWGGVNNSDPIALAGSDSPSFSVGGDGILRIELWEDFDDHAGPDGVYDRGTLTITVVPAPGAMALLGLGGLAMRRRRRR